MRSQWIIKRLIASLVHLFQETCPLNVFLKRNKCSYSL